MKKILSWMLTLALCLSLLPTAAMATNEDVYAILYDDGELVFQNGDTAEDGRTVSNTYQLNLAGYSYLSYIPWHNECSRVSEITFATRIQPTNSMAWWFNGMSNLKIVNHIENLDTSRVTNMFSLFCGCSSLTELDVSGFDTSNVVDFRCMFSHCSNLTALNVTNFDTSSATTMFQMFYYCSSLTILDISAFDTSKVFNMDNMFAGCSNLVEINVGNINTSNVVYMGSMFMNCKSLINLDLSAFDTSEVTDMHHMFYGCSNLVNLKIGNFDTKKVTRMSYMFGCCEQAETFDVGNFDTSSVTSMYGMFLDCHKLSFLDVSKFDTSNVTSMGLMFLRCYSLDNLDVSNFDTSNVTDMCDLFGGCMKISSLDVGKFDTRSANDMYLMFSTCSELESLDLSHFDTSKVTNLRWIFSNCNKLSTVVLGAEFSFKGAAENSGDYGILPTPPSGGAYTGNWKLVSTGAEYSAEYIRDNYPSDELIPGTYVWAMKRPTVTFKNEDGEVICTETVSYEERWENVSKPSAPDKAGYTFWEWQDAPEVLTEDIAVLPAYQINNYTVTFTDESGQIISTTEVKYGTDWADIRKPDAPSKDGYLFSGWKDAPQSVTDNVLVVSTYSQISHNVTFLAENGAALATETVGHGTMWVDVHKPSIEREGYTLSWVGAPTSITEDITVNASYSINSYLVTFETESGDTIERKTVTHGTAWSDISLPSAPIKAGHTFSSWLHAPNYVMEDIIVRATYQIDSFLVSFMDLNDIIIDTVYADYGTAWSAIEKPTTEERDGYTFAGWNNAPSTITESIAVTALYMPNKNTATFIADGNTVATVEFYTGDCTLAAPDVPLKDGFKGEWEEYELSLATSDVVINAIYKSTAKPTHTASFISDGVTIAAITFTEGDETLDEPAVPTKNGTVGRWADYDLKSATGDITITAIYTALQTHTATFKIGDTVIATVPFTEGDTALDEPNIPDKPNYIGAWDAYDLKNAKSDITVEGRYTPVDPDAVSDLGGDTEASYNNGVVTITLHASAPSQTIKVTSEKARPVDVVLVLDQSGSMKDTLGGSQSKRDALVNCANSFVQQLYQNAVATGANHRVALVGFACSDYNSTQAENRGGYVNTGLLATPSGTGKGFNSLTNADYAAALLPIKSGSSINANVITGINSIAAGGATAADVGLKMAKNIFSENPVGSERERIVVFITDGTPTRWTETKANIEQTAQNAIYIASTIKNAQGAKIYSVGVEASANPSTTFSSAASGVTTDWRGNFVSYDFNRFLHAVSSNYPAAASMSNLKDGDKGAGYYMAVNNTASLTKIFDNILYNTVYELKTFDKATLSYTLTNDFILTMEQELAMREALTANGLTGADILVTRNNDGTTELTFRNVPVTQGVVNGASGYHATVSFNVSAAKDASGTVATGSASGVSYGGGDKTISTGVADVTIPANRSVVVFKLNGKVYRMVDAPVNGQVEVPVTDLATWSDTPTSSEEGYVVFEATVNNTYSITWVIDGENTVQDYHPGDAVTPPNAAKDGHIFTGWMPAAPTVMPAQNVTCTATFTEHTHQWVETYKTGTCKTGITTHYVCAACNETKSETAATHDHSFTAVLSDNGSAGTTVEKLVCTDCGYSKNQEVRFKVTYTESRKTTVLDLNLYENEVNKSGTTGENLEMRFFIGDDGGKTYRVTRINEDGTRNYYNTTSEDGYLVFKLDHFSIYVIGELEGEAGQEQEVETVSYEQSTQLLETAKPVVDNTPLPEQTTPSNPSTPSDPNTPSNPSTPSNPGITGYYPWYPSTSPTRSEDEKQEKPNQEKPNQEEPSETKPETPWSNPFADVAESTWYYEAVAWASKLGVAHGTSGMTFSPAKTCSRAEIVTFLWRAKGCPEPTITASPFDDLDENAYYYKAALWAYENGITNGASATSFAPGADCTRAQVVTFLWRAEDKPTVSGMASFADVSGSDYYTEAVAWALAREITNGTGNGNFSPTLVCTRAQIVTFLYRDLAEEAVA